MIPRVESRHVEVDQEADALSREPEICEQLRFVNAEQPFVIRFEKSWP